jgi:hypothetical protein
MVLMHSLCYIAKLLQDLNSIKLCQADCTISWLRHITISKSKQGVKPVSETLAYVNQLMWLSVKENIAGRTLLITPVR